MHPGSDYLDKIAADEAEQARQHAALRDTFAAAALTGMIAAHAIERWSASSIAEDAYKYADRMLEARLKKETQP